MQLSSSFRTSSRFKKTKIDKTNHINERKALGFYEDKFDFENALFSINIELFEFTNYFRSKKEPMFKYVKSEYKRLMYGKSNLDEEYDMKLVNVDDTFNEMKIKKLYADTHSIKINALPLMYKLKNKQNPNLQFFVIMEDNIFKVCFIDIYHLAIPTKEQDAKSKYEENRNNKISLEELKIAKTSIKELVNV